MALQAETLVQLLGGGTEQAVERAGIQQAPAQALGQDAGDRAFARAAWPVDGNHRCFDIHN